MPKIMKGGVEYGGNSGGTVPSAYLAQRAAQDGNGDIIKDTYVKVSEAGIPKMTSDERKVAAYHNSIYRGKDINRYYANGTLYTKISSGTFEDLYIGDYFDATINGSTVRCRIAGFDVYLHTGDQGSGLTQHHAVIVPDTSLMSAKMNSSDTTSGGYKACTMHTTTMATINGYLSATFGNHLISFRGLFSKSSVGSSPCQGYSGYTGPSDTWEWDNTTADLMSEVEVYGAAICGSSGYDVGEARSQLPLFALNPALIQPGTGSGRFTWWLRAVVSSSLFAHVSGDGLAGRGDASYSRGVRPRWLIG